MKRIVAESSVVLASQEVLRRHAKTFRWAGLLLARAERADAAVAYAFCRLVDDTVDEAPSETEARRGLMEIDAMLEGTATASPLVRAYRELSERRGFGLGPARDLLIGVASDLDAVRIEDDAELGTYCYRVAGTVGLMMCGILGVKDPRALRHAVDLGVAMQLTNICRDVREDAERGRIYLPRERLRRQGLSARALLEPGAIEAEPRLRAGLCSVTRELLELAETSYRSGEAGFVYLPMRARLAIAVASRLYAGIGRRLRRVQGADPWQGRVHVPGHEKLLLACRALGTWARASLRRASTTDREPRSALPLPVLEP